jgi:hypothetical protein
MGLILSAPNLLHCVNPISVIKFEYKTGPITGYHWMVTTAVTKDNLDQILA